MPLTFALSSLLAASPVLAGETAGPSLSGAYSVDPDDTAAADTSFALGFQGHVTGAPALTSGLDLGWALDRESLLLDLFLGVGWSVVTVGGFVQPIYGPPGFGLAVGPQLGIGIPFPFVGDASLAQVFGRFDVHVVGDDAWANQAALGLRLVIDLTG
jgi:hypothetical protein